MERCKVICHMMVSIDGKINGMWEDAPLTEPVFGYYYSCIFDEFGPAMAVGSTTNIETIKETGCAVDVDFSKYKDAPVAYGISLSKNQTGTITSVLTEKAALFGVKDISCIQANGSYISKC